MKFSLTAETPNWEGMTLGEIREFVKLTAHLSEDIVPEVESMEVLQDDYWNIKTTALRRVEVKVEL